MGAGPTRDGDGGLTDNLPQSETGPVENDRACFVSGISWLSRIAVLSNSNGLSRRNCPIFSTVAERDYVRKLGVL